MIRALPRPISDALGRYRQQRDDRRAPIYMIAAAGQPNFGDEFITRSWLDWLAANEPKRDVWLDCLEPGRAAHLFRDTHPRLRTTNTLWQLAHSDAGASVEESAERVARLVFELGSPKVDFGLRELRRMRSLHLLGGGYINTIWPNNLNIVAAMVAVKNRFGIPIYATGQGLLPHAETSHDWMRGQLAQFDVVEARDTLSAESFSVMHGTDDAFLAFVNERRIYAPEPTLPQSMILVQGDMPDSEPTAELTEAVAQFVAAAGGASEVGFVEGIPPEDSRFARAYVDDGAHFYPFMRIWDEGFPAYPGQQWLTSRFHFHLLAAAAGAHGVVMSVRPEYYDIKHQLLLELGTGWSMTDVAWEEGQVTPSGAGGFPVQARRLGAQKARLAGQLYGKRSG